MDEYFIGLITEYHDGTIVFETNNHGFVFQGVNLHLLPLNTKIKLYVYFYQRLPISEYFAFFNQATKDYFLALIKINYVGPKLALKILNFFSLEQLQESLSKQDGNALQRVPGVSAKLAQIILAHFKNKSVS